MRSSSARCAGSALVGLAVALGSLSGCGEELSLGEAAAFRYDGPLHLAEGEGRHPHAGAAGDVVDCDAWGTGQAFHGEEYAEGATADTPAKAVRYAFSEGLFFSMPRDLKVSAETDDRVLYVAEVDGLPKAALIVHDGEGTEGAGGDGWYAESWAVCDVVELPQDFVEERGYEVWTDADGRAVPTTELEAVRGPEHCDWQDMTFLTLRRAEEPTFVRGADPDLADYFAEPFREHARLPADAVDTGFRHGDERLWLAPDSTRAYVGATPDDVEVWPRMVQPLGCD
ncbi:MAG TPA: hypothetical protein VGE43_17825 [Acidimicrobiales bacterium]